MFLSLMKYNPSGVLLSPSNSFRPLEARPSEILYDLIIWLFEIKTSVRLCLVTTILSIETDLSSGLNGCK